MGWAGVADTRLNQSGTQGVRLSVRPWAHCTSFLGLVFTCKYQVNQQQRRRADSTARPAWTHRE